MRRQIMLSIWILLMISSINALSPAEKILTSGSPSYSSSQNTEDLLLMSSAKALLSEFQSDNDQFQDEESPSLSRKKRFVWSSPVIPPVTDRPVDSKKFSKVKVNSAPFLGADVAITKDIYEGGFSPESIMVQGGPGESANCMLALAGYLICDKTTTAIPAGTGKVTRKLVQRPPSTQHWTGLIEVDHLECGNGESVELTVRPMFVNTGDYSVAFQTKASLTIYDVFPVYDLDTDNALISSLVVDNGIYISFFHPKREQSLTVVFYSFTTEDLKIIQEFDLVKDTSLEPKFATDGIKDTALVKIGHTIFLIIGGKDSTLTLRMVIKGSDTSFKLDSVLDAPANEIRLKQNRFGTRIKLLTETKITVYTSSRGSFIKVVELDGSFGMEVKKFSAFTEENHQEISLRIVDDSMAFAIQIQNFISAEVQAVPLPNFRSTQNFAKPHDIFSIVGFGRIKKQENEKFLLYVMVNNYKEDTYHMMGYEVTFDEANNFYPASTPLENALENTKLDVEYYRGQLVSLKDTLITNQASLTLIDKAIDHEYNKLQVGGMEVTGSVTDLPTVDIDVIYEVDSADQVSFTDLDYNNAASVISDLIVKSTTDTSSDDYLFKKSVLKNALDSITVEAGVTLTIPDVIAESAEFSQVATETVSSSTGKADVIDFIANSLKTNLDEQKINSKVTFVETAETSSLVMNPAAMPKTSTNKIVPSKMFDITKENSIDAGTTMKFTNIKLSSEADFQGGVNGIDLAHVVKTSGADIIIAGQKTFSEGMLIGDLTLGGQVNGVECEAYFKRKYIYTEDPDNVDNLGYVQTIKTKAFNFNTVKVLDHLYVDKLGAAAAFSASETSLGSVVVTNKDADITNKVIFNKNLNLVKKAITSETLNSAPVASTFVLGAPQVFSSSIDGIKSLYVKDNLQVGRMNGVDLDTEVARIDTKNIFETKVKFSTLGVKEAIQMGHHHKVNGVDVSHTKPIQHYPGTITLSSGGSLFIDQSNVVVDKMDFGDSSTDIAITDQSMLKNDFADEFVYTDTVQELPNLVSIHTTTLEVADLSLQKKLDSLDLETEVMHTGPEVEESSSAVTFTGGVTTFTAGLTIETGEKFGPFNLMDLHKQSYCGHNAHDFKYMGEKNVPKLISNGDVNVHTSLTANGRAFGPKNSFNAAKLSEDNTFTEKISFDALSTTGDVTCTGKITGTPLLNSKNLVDFNNNVVKIDEDATITSPIEMSVMMDPGVTAVITKDVGKLDGTNIFTYLNDRVLLDEARKVTVKLNAPNLKFEKGIKMVPTDATKETYFNGQNLVDYEASLFKDNDNSLSGKKTVTGTVKVGGDLKFATNVHPFGVDLPELKNTAFQKSVEQTVILPYTIGDITEVNKVTVDKIDSVKMNDICFSDETSCTLTCDASLDGQICVHFKKNLKASGGISFDKLENIKMNSVLGDLDSNTNSYNLDELKITSGGLDWTNDKAAGGVSDLMKNLVVKSNKDWSSRDDTATTVQTISADVDFQDTATVSITDLVVSSGLVNAGDATNEVNPQAIKRDAALKVGGNTFTGAKTFAKKVEGQVATVNKIVNLKEINDLNVEDFKNKVVYSEDMTDANLEMAQTITGTWTLSNGIQVDGVMDVQGKIDNVKVEDFVSKHKVQTDKDIPKVTFSQGLTVTGNVDASGTGFQTKLDNFMNNHIRLSTEETINNKLKFTGKVEFVTADGTPVDMTVSSLNKIPANTWALAEPSVAQTVDIKTIFNQETVTINGNLVTNDINDINLSDKWADAVKLNENAKITGPGMITFAEETVLEGKKLQGTLPSRFNVLDTLMVDVSKFVTNLHNFYTENIVGVIPKLDKEIRIAQRLDLGVVSYLDEVAKPKYLAEDFDDKEELTFNAVSVSVLELDKNLFSINYRIDSACTWNPACMCQTSLLSSPLDSVTPRDESQDRTFSFKLSSGTFVLRSSQQSSSADCNHGGDSTHLTISGVFTNPESIDTDMIVLSPTTVGSALKTEDLNLMAGVKVGYVKSAVMWELGSTIYLAVASGYPNKMIAVFRLDHDEVNAPKYTWTREADLETDNDVSNLKVFTFPYGAEEHVHLYTVRDIETSKMWSTEVKEIVIYRQMIQDPVLTNIQGVVGVPGLVDYEVFLHQDKIGGTAQVTLLIGQNFEFFLGPDISVVITLVWDKEYNQYIPAIVPDNVQLIGGEMIKLEEAIINNHKVFIVAEKTRLSVYRFIPFQGLRLVDQVQTGNIVDFTVAKKDYQSDHINIYVLYGSEGDKKASMYKLYTKDNVPTLSLKHGYYQ